MWFNSGGGGSFEFDTTPALINVAVDKSEDIPATIALSLYFSVTTPKIPDTAATKVKTPEAIRLSPTFLVLLGDMVKSKAFGFVT